MTDDTGRLCIVFHSTHCISSILKFAILADFGGDFSSCIVKIVSEIMVHDTETERSSCFCIVSFTRLALRSLVRFEA